jgi:hypothetical protein
MTNNDILLEFWQNHQWQDPKPVMYRLYHDDQGKPLEYSMEAHSGYWIDITPEQYAMADMRVRVVDGVLTLPPSPAPPRMILSDTGATCHPWSLLLLVNPDQPNNKWRCEGHAY